METTTDKVTLAEIRKAASRIAPFAHRTPLLPSSTLSALVGASVRLKCENLQRAGAFKFRGAMNALLQLSEPARQKGVVVFSSGNHAQGVALAAKLLGIPATIVMPEGSVSSKVEATRGYGATVLMSGVTEATRGDVAREVAANSGATVIPPFDDERIIAGAGTVGLEIAEEWPEVRTIVVPVGGGGLISGIALAATSINPAIRIIGVEPAAGNDAQQSFRSGRIVRIDTPRTIADGARTSAIGSRNFDIIRSLVSDIVTVEDEELLEVMRFVSYRTKLLIEPTGALAIAALLRKKIVVTEPVAAILSGGNVDLALYCS